MYILKKIALVFCAFYFLAPVALYAQDKLPIKFGKVKLEDFDVKSALIDSSTSAVIVANVGNSEFIANTTEATFSLLYNEKKRIKIISKNGFDVATVVIPLYVSNGKEERLQDLDAYTYNVEDGKVVATKVDKGSIFTEKKSDNWVYKKFTFPALKEGSIIEYDYKIKSDFFFNLHEWAFQSSYPTLWSQYDAAIPEFYRFITLAQGYHSFAEKKSERSQTSFTFQERVSNNQGGGFNNTGSNTSVETYKIDGAIDYNTWIMKDVPGLKEEAFTTTEQNSISKIEFQLQQVAFPHTIPREVMSNWEKVSEDMMKDERFGALITRPNNWLDETVTGIVKGTSSGKEKTRKIYEYVRDNFSCTNYNRYMVSTSLKDVVKNKNGSVADLNMLLIAMLRTQDIPANPVLLSTRTHGYPNEYYPLMDKYNYIIAQVSTDNETFFLDASTPRLGFNKLPQKVYNGQARVITNEKALPVYFSADSLKETNLTSVFVTNTKTAVSGSVTSSFGAINSLQIRDYISKSGVEKFQNKIKEDLSDDVEVSGIHIDSLKTFEEPVTVRYDLKLNGFGDADVVYFNPMLGDALKKNPFTAAERFYPVEMPYTKQEIYTLTMEIPQGYKVDELPKQTRVMLNEEDGMFEYLISADQAIVQMRCTLQIKKTFFPNEDYQTLRDFYAFIVKKEAEQIVFKKIK